MFAKTIPERLFGKYVEVTGYCTYRGFLEDVEESFLRIREAEEVEHDFDTNKEKLKFLGEIFIAIDEIQSIRPIQVDEPFSLPNRKVKSKRKPTKKKIVVTDGKNRMKI